MNYQNHFHTLGSPIRYILKYKKGQITAITKNRLKVEELYLESLHHTQKAFTSKYPNAEKDIVQLVN